jgi:beta-phosphoglucomutase-like phosphatase (HAD superfamily)
VERQKPAPDLFLHAARQLNLLPAECVVVEDAAAGIEAARAGGFHSVGLGPPERIGEAEAVFPSLSGVRLADLLKALDVTHTSAKS